MYVRNVDEHSCLAASHSWNCSQAPCSWLAILVTSLHLTMLVRHTDRAATFPAIARFPAWRRDMSLLGKALTTYFENVRCLTMWYCHTNEGMTKCSVPAHSIFRIINPNFTTILYSHYSWTMILNKQLPWIMNLASLPVQLSNTSIQLVCRESMKLKHRWTHSSKTNRGSSHASRYGMRKSCEYMTELLVLLKPDLYTWTDEN